MNHALLGAAIPFVLAAVVYAWRGARAGLPALIAVPLLMAAGALWASAPDLPRVFGMHELYLRLAADPHMNVFLWHYRLDQIETESRWYAVGIVVMAVGVLAAAWRELRRLERA
jgi:hypothetical protein